MTDHKWIARTGMEYLRVLPAEVPDGRFLVHNHVDPTRQFGSRGFRAWLDTSADNPRYEVCQCGWAADLGTHYLSRFPGRREVRYRARGGAAGRG